MLLGALDLHLHSIDSRETFGLITGYQGFGYKHVVAKLRYGTARQPGLVLIAGASGNH